MPKELLWLDADGQVVTARVHSFSEVPGTIHDVIVAGVYVPVIELGKRLILRLHCPADNFPEPPLWAISDAGDIKEYFLDSVEIDTAYPMEYWQVALRPHVEPSPVPAAIARHVEAFKTSTQETGIPC